MIAAKSPPPWVQALRQIGQSNLGVSEKNVLRSLVEFWSPSRVIWPSVETLAGRLGMSRRGVQKTLRRLEAHCAIACVSPSRGGRNDRGQGSTSHYWMRLLDGDPPPHLLRTGCAVATAHGAASCCAHDDGLPRTTDQSTAHGAACNCAPGAHNNSQNLPSEISKEISTANGVAFAVRRDDSGDAANGSDARSDADRAESIRRLFEWVGTHTTPEDVSRVNRQRERIASVWPTAEDTVAARVLADDLLFSGDAWATWNALNRAAKAARVAPTDGSALA